MNRLLYISVSRIFTKFGCIAATFVLIICCYLIYDSLLNSSTNQVEKWIMLTKDASNSGCSVTKQQLQQQPLQPLAVPGKQSKGGSVAALKQVNYASVTCGAKVVAANAEAQNPSFILMENKDQYMINPCKAKKLYDSSL